MRRDRGIPRPGFREGRLRSPFRTPKPGTPTTGASGSNLLTWGSAQTARPLRAVRLDDQRAQAPRLSATRPTDHRPPRTAWLSGTPLRTDTFGHPPDTSL